MHVCLGPADVPVRRDLVAEMVPTAFRSGDEHLVSVALFWATAIAHLVGAPDADRQLAAFRERLAVVDNAALRYGAGSSMCSGHQTGPVGRGRADGCR